ncbi:hypothetical protein [Pseudomonas serbica]|jgi:hypothetical protein|uniref:hypothetical protein n=1 Tax=Pseudomonas serbica TaxID=2965074 RepID=UPI00237ACD9A|nr:hypothetical protein [Pseudomonas serbica]
MANNHQLVEGKTPEETLLLNIGHEIENFKPNFPKANLKHTFILSPYGSSMFGLTPLSSGQLYFGIPQLFYEKFKSAKWLYMARVKGQSGLYLVMQIGLGKSQHPIALRIFFRSRRLGALDESITSLRAVPMNKDGGTTREIDVLQGFNLKLLQLDSFVWEKRDENP